MFKFKRSALALSPIVTAVLVAVVALSTTPSGAAALRIASDRLGVTAHAAGGGGGFGIDNLTIAPDASLVAKLAVNVTISYTCQPTFDFNTGGFDVIMSSQAFVSVQEKTGHTAASGQGITNGTAVCDEFLNPTPTVNTMTVLVQPSTFPISGPFKNGTALANTSVIACPNTFVASGVPPPCDFGSVGPTIISIK
ncbi:MAG TPA: hypothetical protein VF956_02605 [Candidatus Dormibacteraeota bacterium]